MGQLLGKDNRVRQAKVYFELVTIYFLYRSLRLDDRIRWPRLSKWNDRLKSIEPWRLILLSLTLSYVIRSLSLLCGLNAPHHSLLSEPDMHYSPSFSRVRWILTSLDAGVLSTFRVKNPILRHFLTLVLGGYYLISSRSGEKKVQKFRDSLTTEYVRAMWEKGQHPVLKWFAEKKRKKCKIEQIRILPRLFQNDYHDRNRITNTTSNSLSLPLSSSYQLVNSFSPSSSSSPSVSLSEVECYLFYSGDVSSLSRCSRLILHFPGGGFVAQTPHHHSDYLSYWANLLDLPVLSVNYRKAPAHPFPDGLNDCFEVYKQLIVSNGKCIGMNSDHRDGDGTEKIQIALVGDSAGGNLAAAVTLKSIVDSISLPIGVHLIYPSLDMVGDIWRREEIVDAKPQPFQDLERTEEKENNKLPQMKSVVVSGSESESEFRSLSPINRTAKKAKVPILGSRMAYAFDGYKSFTPLLQHSRLLTAPSMIDITGTAIN